MAGNGDWGPVLRVPVVLAPFVLILALAPGALAHTGEHGLDEQLVERGDRLMLGGFTAPQPGPLVVLPLRDGELRCDGEGAPFRVALDEAGTTFALAMNESHLVASFDVADSAIGWGSFAVDTNGAVRTLVLMQEHAVALHRAGAFMVNETEADLRSAIVGVPYELPVEAPHELMGDIDGEGGVQVAYEAVAGVASCGEEIAFSFERAARSSLAPGGVVHAVLMFDPELAVFLPRPIEDSTVVFQLNLYLTREGENPAHVADALDPSPSVHEFAPAGALGLGAVALAFPWRRRGA